MAIRLEEIDPGGIDRETALEIFKTDLSAVFDLFPVTGALRERYFGRKVKLCSIVNAKSGRCPEDCAFCVQSAHFRETEVKTYPMISPEEMGRVAEDSRKNGSNEFSVVTSGYSLRDETEWEGVGEAIRRISVTTDLEPCASLGILSKDHLLRLKEAGLKSYHHNIETAPSFHPRIVTTHTYEEELEVIRNAQEIGLKVCCGGIFGMGESLEQRVEFIFEVKRIDPDCFPINFLNPRPGTPLEGLHELTPLECLKIVAVSRLAMPSKSILVLGGREVNLRDLQPLIFLAGANGTMVGNYLTTGGRPPEETLRMIRDLGLEPVASPYELS